MLLLRLNKKQIVLYNLIFAVVLMRKVNLFIIKKVCIQTDYIPNPNICTYNHFLFCKSFFTKTMQPCCNSFCISLAKPVFEVEISFKRKHHRTTQAVKYQAVYTLTISRGNLRIVQLPLEGKRVSCEDWCVCTSPPQSLPTCLGQSTEERTALTTRCQTSTCSETFYRMNSTFTPQMLDERHKAKCTNVKPPLRSQGPYITAGETWTMAYPVFEDMQD